MFQNVTLQRQNTEISKQIFPEKEYRGLSPNFHIHVSVSDLSVCLFCWRKYVDWSWDYMNRSQTHKCWNWGWARAIPRKGKHKWDFRCSVQMRWTLLKTKLNLQFRKRNIFYSAVIYDKYFDNISVEVLGQFHRQGPISVWRICPLFKGTEYSIL